MRILNLLLTILASRQSSTSKPLSPHLIQNVVCIISMAVVAGVLGAALLMGAHIGLYLALINFDLVDSGYALMITAGVGIIILSAVVADIIYRIKHLWQDDIMGLVKSPPMVAQLAAAPEAFLQGLFADKNSNRR